LPIRPSVTAFSLVSLAAIDVHFLSGLIKQFLLLASLLFIAKKLFLSQLLFPFFTFLSAAIRTGEAVELLGVGYLELMGTLITAKKDFRGK
jgi:hypothetical protein